MNQEKATDLTRLMNCLVSHTAKDDLYSRFDDDVACEHMNGLTPELADIGISWWVEHDSLFENIVLMFEESLLTVGKKSNIDLKILFQRFNTSTWADYIRESFYFASDLIHGEKSLDDLSEFLKFAVEMSLEYSGENDLAHESLVVYDEAFQVWWREREPFRLFSTVFDLTLNGREVINRD